VSDPNRRKSAEPSEMPGGLNHWEQAIADAEKLIQHHKGKIQKLRGAIVGFKDMRDQGVPWPGDSEPTPTEERVL
jgi:hypothetical protein